MSSTSPEPRPARQPTHLAAFDLDGTLTEGGSVFPFLVAVAGLPRVLATSLLLAGHYEGANCRGEEKLARLERWREQLDEGHGVVLWAYGNSRGDQRMLEAADHPVYVGKLGVLSPLRRFPRLSESPDPRSAT